MKLTDSGVKWLALVAGVLALVCPVRRVAAESQYLRGQVPAASVHLAACGELAGTNWLRLAIGLPLRNQIQLTNLLSQLYRPGSTNYHHFLKPDQFAEQFGPAAADYETLAAFARAQGLTVTGRHANRTVLDVAGSVSQIERVLHTRLRLYPHPREARLFFAPDSAPSLDLSVPVLHISGLDDWVRPHPMNLQFGPRARANSDQPWRGSAPGGAYWGRDFRKAYVPGTLLTGQGQQVGLLQLDSGFYPGDIARYERDAGLPGVPVTPVLLNNYNGGPGLANDECSLDIEMAIAMAPGLLGVLVYEGTVPDDILNQMATDDLAQQLSSSYAFSVDATTEQTFQQFAAQGQSFYNASGDDDAWVGGVTPPSDDPNITSVGGTTLTTDAQGAWSAEVVWQVNGTNGSGGGISTQYPIPAWQQGLNLTASQGSTTMRNLPDVALTADNVYVYFGNGSAGYFGGTSCASPLWAGFTALVNQQAANNLGSSVGFVNPAIYNLGQAANYASLFHDIVTGNNTNSASGNLFFAVPGYDLCTGWGTPAGQSLIDALVGPAQPTPPFLTVQPQSQTVTAGGTITLSALAGGYPPLRYQWQFARTNLTGATNATLTLNNIRTNQAGSYRVLVANAYGTTTSSNASLTVEPSTCDPAPAGLVGWWAAEGNASDSQNLNPAAVVGSVGYAAGEVGQAFVLDGSSGYLTVPASPSLDVGDAGTGLTIECWINPTAAAVNLSAVPMVEWDSPVTDGAQFCLGGTLSGNLKDTANNSHPINSPAGLLITNAWQHVALTYDEASGNAVIYLNGQVVAAQPLGSFTPQTSFPMNIGSRTAPVAGQGVVYNGLLDEVSIYNRALSASEIQGVFLAGGSGKCPTPPVIINQPANTVARAYGSAQFAVTAAGSSALAYQWMFNGTNLTGATNATLTLTNVQPNQAGSYSVLVANPVGSVVSSNALLTLPQLDHFAWAKIPSPRFVNSPFTTTIVAQNVTNGLVTNYTGTVALSATSGQAIQPPVSGAFVNGSWTGAVTVAQTATNLVLLADDGQGDTGLANAINILPPPVLGVAQYGGLLVLFWPANVAGFEMETAPRLDATNWIPVGTPPGLFLNQYFAVFPMTATNTFYRLLYTLP